MRTTEHRSIGEFVSENINTAKIFSKYGIDFCCGGGRSIEKACQSGNIDMKVLMKELETVAIPTPTINDYNSWKIDDLASHIVNVHHSYIRESIPQILQYGSKVVSKHGDDYPELHTIFDLFHEMVNELMNHMKREELVLFPYVNKLSKVINQELSPSALNSSHEKAIALMEEEHEHAGNVIKKIQSLSNNFTPPTNACASFEFFYSLLKDFQEDLLVHIHLENNILFVKIREIESKVLETGEIH